MGKTFTHTVQSMGMGKRCPPPQPTRGSGGASLAPPAGSGAEPRPKTVFSRTFQDLELQFPGLSRTKVIFQDFPGPGFFKKKNPALSRRRGNPVYSTNTIIFQQIEDSYGAGNNESLASFNAINSSNDVDGVCTEYSQHPHIHVVQHSYSHRTFVCTCT